MTTEAPTGVVPAPAVRLPSAFPNRADRQNRTYNTKAEGWATSVVVTAEDIEAAGLAAQSNAAWAELQAEAAELAHTAAVADTAALKAAAVAETSAIRGETLAARDAAAASKTLALAAANYKGQWSTLSGALNTPASVWHNGAYWGLLSNLANVATAQPGVSSAWAAVGTQVHRLDYDNRASLRTLGYPGLEWALVDGLGLFAFTQASTEPDDDESCFATATGRWLLSCPHWDLVDAWQLPDTELRDERLEDAEARILTAEARILTGTAASSITSVAPGSQVSFTGTVAGAAVGDRVLATPPNALAPGIAYFARVTSANTVTVYLNNPSAAAQGLTAATWGLAVIKP